MSTEFGVRNLAIGTFVAVGLEGNYAFAGSAAVYLLLEAIVLIGAGQVRRRRLQRGPTAVGDGLGTVPSRDIERIPPVQKRV